MDSVDVSKDAYIILGASGQLGSRTAAVLAARKRPMLLVGRQVSALLNTARQCSSAKTLLLDLVTDDKSRLFKCVHMEGSRLVIIDTVVDKTTTDSMRASIAAATQTVVDLTRVARSAGKVCLVVCANSVAAYATWPSQTAYSKAKRSQADVYETLSIPAIIVHFPVLYAAQCAGGGIVHGLLGAYFCFDTHASSIETASRILGAATILGQPNHCTRMFVKTRRYAMARLRGIPSQSLLKKSLAAFAAPFVLLLGKWVLRHDPAWQRLAAYALRYVLPRRLLSLDHHLVADEHHTVGSPDLQMGALKFYLSDPWVCDARQEILEIADQE